MNEEIEYAEMLEIPVSTVNVVKKRRRKKAEEPLPEPEKSALKDSVIATVNDRLQEESVPPLEENGGLDLDFDDRIDTVRLYGDEGDFPLPEKTEKPVPKGVKIALGIEFGVACALCAGIFLTNVFMPNSAINTFFRALNTPREQTVEKLYTDFDLTPVVSDLSDAKLALSPAGILSFTDECHVYPAADGKVSEIIEGEDGLYTLKISHTDAFTGVVQGLSVVYYAVGDSVKSNVPVGFTKGESEVQITMYADGILLNCFELTEENCLAWIATDE